MQKVKLLRQLGMSLGTIKGLQQGTENFGAALTARIQALEQQIKAANKAKEVCAALRSANVCYDTLDVEYYLKLFIKEETSKPARAMLKALGTQRKEGTSANETKPLFCCHA